jgi:Rps23 Pro-64 3,4-dihydroxylase Tpa1-like proline 4-hydroxylase
MQSSELAPPPVRPANATENAKQIREIVLSRLRENAAALRLQYADTAADQVPCCWLDDVLPEQYIEAAHRSRPPLSRMLRLADKKERKYVCAKVETLADPIRDLVLAFADQEVANEIAKIIGKRRLEADTQLYNGGLSVMMPGDYMCPHLDNSHDYSRVRHREVVVLFYLSPGWQQDYGGHLELWNRRRGGKARMVPFSSNRMVIMEASERSWHSVGLITGPLARDSLTTYFYAPATEKAPVRLTRFTSWPNRPVQAMLFEGEFRLRNLAARFIGRKLVGNAHMNAGTAAAPQAGTQPGG